MSHSATGNSKKARSRVLPTGTAAFCYAGNIIHLKTRAKTSQPPLRKAQPLNHPKHREAFFKRVPFSIQSFNAGCSRRHPPHTSRTRSGYITHLQPCAATHEKSAPRELHPTGHARRIHSLQTVCINRSLSTAPVDIDLFLKTVFDHSLTEMQHILRTCPLFIQKNITKRLSDNRKNHYLCIHNHSTASLKRRSEAHTSPPSPLSTKQ